MLDSEKLIREIDELVAEKYNRADEIFDRDGSHETQRDVYQNMAEDFSRKLYEIRKQLIEDREWFVVTHLHRGDLVDVVPEELHERLNEIPDDVMRDIADRIGEACTETGLYWDVIRNAEDDIMETFKCPECGEYPCMCE